MKKMVLTLLVTLFSTNTFAQVINGDFRNGLDGWDVLNNYVPLVTTKGLELKDNTNIRQDIFSQLKAGKDYRLAIYGLAVDPTINLNVGVRFYNNSWVSLQDSSVRIISPSSGYLSLKFRMPVGATKAFVYIRRYTGATIPSAGYISKISVSEIVTATSKLKYAKPVLVNPITIPVGVDYSALKLDLDKDYILQMPAVAKTRGLLIQGGRNVVVIGGHIKFDKAINALTGDINHRAIYIKDNKGTVHLEGITIEGDGIAFFDGIAISAPDSVVQVQNMRITNLFGTNSGFHADIIQPFGGVKELRVDKLTGSSYYQGLQLGSAVNPIGPVKLSRVNLSSLGNYSKDSGGQLFWLISTNQGYDCSRSFPVTLSDVFILPRADGWGLGAAAFPVGTVKDDFGVMCGGVLNSTKTEISFPLLPVTGVIKGGVPATGDFVPLSVPGLKYVSPGYN